MNNVKRSFLTSLISLVLCLTMFLGTTFAWFTDIVVSGGNIIQSGKLDAEMYWSDEYLASTDSGWTQVKDNKPIFTYDNWEPGYTEIKYIKVANAGNLNFKWKLSIEAEGKVTDLSDVIDVYYVNPVNGELTKQALAARTPDGKLTDVLANKTATEGDQLTPGGSVVLAIAFHMDELAGNEYQEKSLCDKGFSLKLLATQATGENDSFDDQYDKESEWPEIPSAGNNASADVPTDANGVVTTETTITGNGMSATVPAGTQLTQGTNKLTLSVNNVEDSKANVTLGDGEELRALDVHISGVAEGNTTPIAVTLIEALPKGLNIGNYTLYHVEDGQTVPMTLPADGATPVHNNFTYDPVTGDVTLYMASFSEIGLIAEPAKWEGNRDYSWYTNAVAPVDGEAVTEYVIANADQLAAFSAIVGGMVGQTQDSFAGKTVKLIADIDLNDAEKENKNHIFYPIGYWNNEGNYEKTSTAISSGFYSFCGIFDGNGHTVSNFYHNTWEMKGDHNWYDATLQYYRDGMGLFGRVYKGTVKNLTVKNFSSDGEIATTGVIAAYADGATFENIAIFNCNPRVYNIGNGGIVGCVGWYAKEAELKTTFTNITVDNSNKISALWGSYDVACGGIVGQYYPTSGQSSANYPVNGGIEFVNCHISAQMDVYNDVCGNYQYYAYRYAGMMIGSIRENTTNEDGKTIPNMTDISATGCTVNYGDWNDYYYCEFEKNGHPSYSGPNDYKFSRVPHSELEFTDSNGNGLVDADERASVTGCKHNHTDAENNRAVYLPFYQLFTGYGWGVSSIGLKEYSGIVTDLGITEGEIQESITKFDKVKDDPIKIETETTIKIGELFKQSVHVSEKLPIKDENVQVTVSPKHGTISTAGATYVADTENWTNGTLTFFGTGEATITITDYYFCTATTITVTVTATDKIETKFTGDFLYRVGNQNAIKLGSMFQAKNGVILNNVEVSINKKTGVTVEYTPNATWTNGEIKFTGTGIVEVMISADGAKPVTQVLEVVDATNVTGLSGTISGNVVLLNNCGLSSLTVSGRNTVYGNGFTATYSGNGQYLNNGLKHGVITVSENGTLDNLRIKASVYSSAYLFYSEAQNGPKDVEGTKTRYHYQLSAVAATGNATIQNCYIYGGRTNIYIGGGNVTVKDTILECGTLANSQIISSNEYTVTFENVTTIQHQVNATVGTTTNVMFGAGILVGDGDKDNENATAPEICLKGYFKQYNWVTDADKNAVSDSNAKMIINGALNATGYNHTINGKTSSNLGIIYLNTGMSVTVKNETGLPYAEGSVALSLAGANVSRPVYSLKNAKAEQIYSDYDSADRSTVNGLYVPQFKYPSDLGGQYIEKTDDGDEFLYREGDTIHVLFPSGDTKEIDLATLVNIVKYSGQSIDLVITVKDENGNAVTVTDGKVNLSDAGNYTVTYTVTDTLFYGKDGNKVAGEETYSWDVVISVSLKDTAIPNAYFEFDSTKQVIYRSGNSNIKQFIPFLAGLKIYDYNGQTSYLRFDGDNDFNKIAKASINNINTSGEAQGYHIVTIELTDGGKLVIDMDVRANSGSSTHSGSLKVRNNVLYVVNGGTTSGKGQTWKIYSYKFIGNNGTEINSGLITFGTAGVDCSTATTPSSNFSTTIKYTVTYDANGGNCGQTTGYATSAATAVTLPTPSRSGYIFAGWYTAASGGTRVGGAGDSYTHSANITLYAQWGKPCTVTYNANGGTCGIASDKYTGTALTLPTPTRDGYWFVGWYDAAEGGNKIGGAGAKYNPANEITLYAHWQEAIKYTVTYNANGGTCGTASATYQGTALTLPTPTRTGWTFNGWYTATSGGTKIGNAGADYIPSANITLYAQWTINSYKVTITTSNASVSGVTNGQMIEYGTTVSVTVSFDKSNSRTFTVKCGSETLLNKSTAGTYTFTMPAGDVTINVSSSGCFAEGSLVTLADGTQKPIEDITYEDQLLAWDFFTGTYVATVPSLIDRYELSEQNVINLQFADGTVVRVVIDHGFFDVEANKFVFINEENVASYVGHTFVKASENGTYENVELVGYEITVENISYYSIQTAVYNNCIVEGVFTLCAPPEMIKYSDWFNYFEIGEGMKYDEEKMQADIEQYGLYTYEDFAEYVTYEQFMAFNGPYLKVLVGRGVVTYEQIIELIRIYVNPEN